MLDRKGIKLDVRAFLKGRWYMVFFAALLMGAVTSFVSLYVSFIPIINILGGIVLGVAATALTVSMAAFVLRFARGENPRLEEIFTSMKGRFFAYLGAYWWRALWVALWSMLLIVPGIIKCIAYSFTYYIISENPNIGAQRALKLSIAMTDGHKGELFVLQLSFFWWYLIYIIGYFYVYPYIETTYAVYYEKFKERAIAEGKVNPSDFIAV